MTDTLLKKAIYIVFFIPQILHAQFPGWQWAKSANGTGWDVCQASLPDLSGNLIATGIFSDTVDFDPGPGIHNLVSAGNYDIFISKLDSNGNFEWARRFGNAQDDWGMAVSVDAANNYYITGKFTDSVDFDPGPGTYFMTGYELPFILKLSPEGNFIWAVCMESPTNSGSGNSIVVDPQQNIYTTGSFNGPMDFDPGPGTFILNGSTVSTYSFMVKLDSAANFIWAKQMGGTMHPYGNAPVVLDSACNIYYTGHFSGTADFDQGPAVMNYTAAGLNDVFITKSDSSGNFIWTKQFSGPDNEIGYAVVLDTTGDIFTMGFFNDSVDFDPGPATYNITAIGYQDTYLIKLDTAGSFIWAKSIGSANSPFNFALSADFSGNLYLSGYFAGTVDFDPGPGITNMTSTGDWSVYLIKLNNSGNLLWAYSTLAGGGQGPINVSFDHSGYGYLTGAFSLSSIDFSPYILYNVNPITTTDMFFAKLAPSVTGVAEIPEKSPLILYPNPVTDKLFINSRSPVTSIRIMDVDGRLIKKYMYTVPVTEIAVTLPVKGIYLVEINLMDGERKVEKVVILGK